MIDAKCAPAAAVEEAAGRKTDEWKAGKAEGRRRGVGGGIAGVLRRAGL